MPYLKSTKSPLSKRELPGWLVSKPIAHRGLHDISKGVPENSSAAFSFAIDQNLPIELDIQLSKDGHPVIMHDASLLRTTGRSADVADLTLTEICALTLEQTGEEVPSLRDVLQQVTGKVPLVIELKSTPFKKPDYIRALCAALNGYTGSLAVQSFDPFLMLELRRQRPEIIRGQLGFSRPPKEIRISTRFIVKSMPFLRNVQADYVAYDVAGLGTRRIRRLREQGMPLLAWTVDNMEKLDLARQQADNIIFEKLPLAELSIASGEGPSIL